MLNSMIYSRCPVLLR